MSQSVAGVTISGSFVDFPTLYEYFSIRVDVFFKGEVRFCNFEKIDFKNIFPKF